MVTIYDRHGELRDEIVLQGQCTGMAWDKDGDTLAIINDKNGVFFAFLTISLVSSHNPNLSKFLQSLSHRHLVADLSIFYLYFMDIAL